MKAKNFKRTETCQKCGKVKEIKSTTKVKYSRILKYIDTFNDKNTLRSCKTCNSRTVHKITDFFVNSNI